MIPLFALSLPNSQRVPCQVEISGGRRMKIGPCSIPIDLVSLQQEDRPRISVFFVASGTVHHVRGGVCNTSLYEVV